MENELTGITDKSSQAPKKGKIGLAIAALLLDLVPVIYIVFSRVKIPEIIVFGAVFLLIAAVITSIVFLILKKKRLAVSGAAIAVISVIIIGLGDISFLFLFIAVVMLPLAGIMMGVVSLCLGKQRSGILGLVLSVFASALPILAVLTVILLTSTGIMVISLM